MTGRCFRAGLGVLVMGLGGRARGLWERYIGPDGALILAVGVRLAHLEGGRWFAGRAGREKLLLGFEGGNSTWFTCCGSCLQALCAVLGLELYSCWISSMSSSSIRSSSLIWPEHGDSCPTNPPLWILRAPEEALATL